MNSLSLLGLVVDRSGSMYNSINDVNGGVTTFIDEQKKVEGDAKLLLTQFDHEHQVVENFTSIKNVNPAEFVKNYSPRGSTALLDALGLTIMKMQAQLEVEPKTEKSPKVIIAIITDGEENSSRDPRFCSVDKIKKLIEEKKALGWEFLFLGASLDSIEVAGNMGFSKENAAVYDTANTKASVSMFSTKVTQGRQGQKVAFSNEERESLLKPQGIKV